MSLQNLKRHFGGLIIWLSNENMKNFNFTLKHWCWMKIVVFINTTGQGCDPLLKLGRCYPIELTTVESNQHSTVSFFNLHPAVWAGVIPLKLTTVESNQNPTMSFFNLHPAVSNLPHVYTSCRVKLTLRHVRWILLTPSRRRVNICGCGPLLKLCQC